ncbi:MAG: CoA ester lyase [Acidimicrobiales bacterium]|nr:CoA ester lyase [Acidimicrobiaceae bacterium]MXY03778.1 CoA ester lyase [Acidimicrobiales bacterium]MDE0677006.1 CoA ester lyase [Acidimicrobiaceae bacterium]MYA82421.1 CoA ester lyase [Acidimicrobiales bacterium]MYG89764.1 CoA ester lyase [Acidimicrobiales bacterium]
MSAAAARPARPRRSVLYMPAANARALEKAKAIGADALIFDLEDAVAPDAKEAAREGACAAASSGEYGYRELTIRCNGLDTPWGRDDIRAAGAAAPSAVVIPKVSSAAHLAAVSDLLDTAGAPDSMRIWAMIETPAGIAHAREIAGFERTDAVVMGTNDMAKELHATITPDRAALVPHLATCLVAAREAGVTALDGVYNDIRDADGFAAVCRQGADLGFDGKTLIHPSQVDPANEAFSPSLDELDFHRQVIEAFEAAVADGRGVVTVDGKMVENLHVDEARRAIALADAIAQR